MYVCMYSKNQGTGSTVEGLITGMQGPNKPQWDRKYIAT